MCVWAWGGWVGGGPNVWVRGNRVRGMVHLSGAVQGASAVHLLIDLLVLCFFFEHGCRRPLAFGVVVVGGWRTRPGTRMDGRVFFGWRGRKSGEGGGRPLLPLLPRLTSPPHTREAAFHAAKDSSWSVIMGQARQQRQQEAREALVAPAAEEPGGMSALELEEGAWDDDRQVSFLGVVS